MHSTGVGSAAAKARVLGFGINFHFAYSITALAKASGLRRTGFSLSDSAQ
jgi:hypothetical protein